MNHVWFAISGVSCFGCYIYAVGTLALAFDNAATSIVPVRAKTTPSHSSGRHRLYVVVWGRDRKAYPRPGIDLHFDRGGGGGVCRAKVGGTLLCAPTRVSTEIDRTGYLCVVVYGIRLICALSSTDPCFVLFVWTMYYLTVFYLLLVDFAKGSPR